MKANFKIIGINDEAEFCQCCGKQNLARVVWLENLESGEIEHRGTTCATFALMGNRQKGNVSVVVNRASFIETAKKLLASNMPDRDIQKELFNRFGYPLAVHNRVVRSNVSDPIKL